VISEFQVIIFYVLGLQASLLVRHPETNKLYVNFDPMVMTLIKETDCMVKLDLQQQTYRKKQRLIL